MLFERIEIRNVRIVEHAVLEAGSGINVICGVNGSGKTSLLEGIFLLGRGRSFRNGRANSPVRRGAPELSVTGRTVGGQGCRGTVGIRRGSGRAEYHLDGIKIKAASVLARKVPVVVVDPEGQSLFDGGPKVRRRLLDWSVFHVEPGYLSLWKRYNRALRQRSRVLREGGAHVQLASWESELEHLGMQLHERRREAVTMLQAHLDDLLESDWNTTARIGYSPGWDTAVPLGKTLLQVRDRDLRCGYTTLGPHRADIELTIDGNSASGYLSRGQAKLFVTAVICAHARMIGREGRESPVVLVDDARSELDAASASRMMLLLQRLGSQVFVTTTDVGWLADCDPASPRMFHVERGQLRSML